MTLAQNKTRRQPDPIWDAVAALFFPSGVAKLEYKRVGRIVSILKDKHATPDDIRRRYRLYHDKWPTMACTPEALVKHWDTFPEANHRQGPTRPQQQPVAHEPVDAETKRLLLTEAMRKIDAAKVITYPRKGHGGAARPGASA